jgi:hypothetical protein
MDVRVAARDLEQLGVPAARRWNQLHLKTPAWLVCTLGDERASEWRCELVVDARRDERPFVGQRVEGFDVAVPRSADGDVGVHWAIAVRRGRSVLGR